MARFGTTLFPRIRIGVGAGRYIYLPVLTSTQRNALSASAGYLIYNSTTGQLENYNGSSWVASGKVYGDATFLPLAGGQLSGNLTFAGAQTVDGIDISAHAIDYGLHAKIVRKAADETVNNSTVFQSDNELLFPIAANEIWTFECCLLLDGSTAAGFKTQWSGPAGAVIYTQQWGLNAAAASAISYSTEPTSRSWLGNGAGSPAITVAYRAIVRGAATPGNVYLQWAQNTAESSNSKVLTDSFIRAHRLA